LCRNRQAASNIPALRTFTCRSSDHNQEEMMRLSLFAAISAGLLAAACQVPNQQAGRPYVGPQTYGTNYSQARLTSDARNACSSYGLTAGSSYGLTAGSSRYNQCVQREIDARTYRAIDGYRDDVSFYR
jgi:hypothetical protein